MEVIAADVCVADWEVVLLYAITSVEDIRCIDLGLIELEKLIAGVEVFAPELIRCDAEEPKNIELFPVTFPSNLPNPNA